MLTQAPSVIHQQSEPTFCISVELQGNEIIQSHGRASDRIPVPLGYIGDNVATDARAPRSHHHTNHKQRKTKTTNRCCPSFDASSSHYLLSPALLLFRSLFPVRILHKAVKRRDKHRKERKCIRQIENNSFFGGDRLRKRCQGNSTMRKREFA